MHPPMLFLLLVMIPAPLCVVTQQTSVTYEITDALESLTANVLLSAVPPLDNLLYVQSLTPLTLTTVLVEACDAGAYSGIDSQTCSLCQAGSYSETVTATSQDTCIPCGTGKYSNASGASSPTFCKDCPVNTYGLSTGTFSIELCLPCPTNSFSYQGSQMLQSCVCLPGYSGPNGELGRVTLQLVHMTNYDVMGVSGGPCFACNTSVWCLNGQENPCAPHSNASMLSSSLAQCLCKPGYFGDTTMSGVGFPMLCQVRGGRDERVKLFFKIFISVIAVDQLGRGGGV